MKMRNLFFVLFGCSLAAAVEAASISFVAREGTMYTGDQLVSDTGGPPADGLDGEVFEQFLTYSPQLSSVYEEQTAFWDEGTQQLAGFTENATSHPYDAKATETVTWNYGAASWHVAGTAATNVSGATSIVERAPLIVPFTPPSSGGGDSYFSALEIMELEMAGADSAMRLYLDPNYDLNGVTKAQFQQDLLRLEAILAGYYSPPVPLPAPLGLLAAGAALTLWRGRRRTSGAS
jgi:hypothetical protein